MVKYALYKGRVLNFEDAAFRDGFCEKHGAAPVDAYTARRNMAYHVWKWIPQVHALYHNGWDLVQSDIGNETLRKLYDLSLYRHELKEGSNET